MPISRSTKAAFIRALSSIGHSDLSLLYYEYDVEARDPGGNKIDRAWNLVRAIEGLDQDDGGDRLMKVLDRFLAEQGEWQLESDEFLNALARALSLDGYTVIDGRVIPSDPVPVSREPVTSAFEQELRDHDLNVAATHLRQAVDNYIGANFEAANSQVRSYFEDLSIAASELATGLAQNNPSAALQALRNGNLLDDREWQLFRHFWAVIQDEGPHRGLTTAEEAEFRLHTGVSLGRYLIWKAR